MTETSNTEKPPESVDMVEDYFNMQARMEMTLAHLSTNLGAVMSELIAETKANRVEEVVPEGESASNDQRFTDVDCLNRLLKSAVISMTYCMILLAPQTAEGEELVEAVVEWLSGVSKVAGPLAAAHALDLRHQALHIGQDNKQSSGKEASH